MSTSAPSMLIVIPARLTSTRLPRKPLQRIQGKPLLQWVVEEVLAMDLAAPLVVATDSVEVCREVVGWACGGYVQLVLVGKKCRNGTERVAEVFRTHPEYKNVDVVVNIQADQLRLPKEAVLGAVDRVIRGGDSPRWGADSVGTVVATDMLCRVKRRPPSVRALVDVTGKCLSFWRHGQVPEFVTPPTIRIARHIGVYAYHPKALAQWAALPPLKEEMQFGLEQLRPLAAGMPIGAFWLTTAPPFTIDTPEDLQWVRAAFALPEGK